MRTNSGDATACDCDLRKCKLERLCWKDIKHGVNRTEHLREPAKDMTPEIASTCSDEWP